MGRPPRVLPYELFRDFEVSWSVMVGDNVMLTRSNDLPSTFEYFRREFQGLSLVQRGQYLLMNKVNNLRLNEANWHRHVAPGSTTCMPALMLTLQRNDKSVSRYPEPACKGTWQTPNLEVWTKWCDMLQYALYIEYLEANERIY